MADSATTVTFISEPMFVIRETRPLTSLTWTWAWDSWAGKHQPKKKPLIVIMVDNNE